MVHPRGITVDGVRESEVVLEELCPYPDGSRAADALEAEAAIFGQHRAVTAQK